MPVAFVPPPEFPKDALTPCFLSRIPAGFPSPADDYVEQRLDLHDHLIERPSATVFCRVSGESMEGVGIYDHDLLIVDRSLSPQQGDVVVAQLNGELTCKILDLRNRCLRPANESYPVIRILEGSDFEIEGVVTASIRYHRVRSC